MSKYVISAPSTDIPDIKVWRGDGGPKLESGHAKWEVIDRPKRKGMTRFIGTDPMRMSLPILFDGWKGSRSVEIDINNLERMRRVVGVEPPKVKINPGVAGGLPIRDIAWVIEEVQYGDNQIWDFNPKGTLVRFRQDAALMLLEYVAIETALISSRLPGNTRGTKNGNAKPPYKVKVGDTLQKIAAKHGTTWKKIAALNNISDPRRIKVGQVLKLP